MKRVDHLQDESFSNDMKHEKELQKEYNDSIPLLVNECIYQMSVPVGALLEKGDDFYEVLRHHLNTRGKCFERALSELFFKYTLVNVVENKINKKKEPFVLYLQDFAEKCFAYEHGTIIKAENYSGLTDIINIAEKFPGITFVYIGVPFDSSSLDYASLNLIHGKHKNVLRVDCDKNWFETVKQYIKEASCILVNVEILGKGIKKEISFIKEKGYLQKTCFVTNKPKIVQDYTEVNVLFTDKNYQDVETIFNKNKDLRENVNLPVSSFWMNGHIRQELESGLHDFENECIESCKNNKKESAVIQLDNYFIALGSAIVLEDFSRITSFLYPIINLISFYSPCLLKNRKKQIFSYLTCFYCFAYVLKKIDNYKTSLSNNKLFLKKYYNVSFIKRIVFFIEILFSMHVLKKNICIKDVK